MDQLRRMMSFGASGKSRVLWNGKSYDVPNRDVQRSKLYAAERAVFSIYRRTLTFKEVERFVRKVEKSATWRKIHNRIRVNPLSRHWRSNIQVAIGQSNHSATGGSHGLKLPEWAWNPAVILHEMAHCVHHNGIRHSWPFAAVYLELVGRFIGAAERDKLKASFRKHKVRFTPPRQYSDETKEKLRQRGLELALQRRENQNPDEEN